MREWFDLALGRALSRLGDASLSSFGAYRLLFLPGLTGSRRNWVALQRARAVFWNARRRVPAYREFLIEQGALEPRAFSDVPISSKQNYILRHPLPSLCQGGRLPERGVVLDESSGSSGTATTWVRGAAERHATRRLIQFSARAAFGRGSFVLLNAFALGPWATGMNVSMSLVDRCILKSIGPDAKKLGNTLRLLGPGYRYVITGYPPFLRSFVESEELDWKRYDICAVVGGEGMSEALRAVLNRYFKKTISSFGASDLEINLATENDFTLAVRQAASISPALARDLFGSGTLPMVFQYDPLNLLVEEEPDERLLFTLNRLENVSPRIRYDLHDRGRTRELAHVLRVLADHRVKLELPSPPLALPLLFHWGRREHAVAFYGCKITPEDVEAALARLPELAASVAHFGLHSYEDAGANKRLEIWLELKLRVTAPETAAVTASLLGELAAVNQDYREASRMMAATLAPSLRFFPSGESPMSNPDLRVKKRYIFEGPAEPR
jgi:phenylacetate-CoA ligase